MKNMTLKAMKALGLLDEEKQSKKETAVVVAADTVELSATSDSDGSVNKKRKKK